MEVQPVVAVSLGISSGAGVDVGFARVGVSMGTVTVTVPIEEDVSKGIYL
jgi:hypothetical protein